MTARDLIDFDGQDLYFDEPLPAGAAALLNRASAAYPGPDAAEALRRAEAMCPDSLAVLVALYRFHFYRHRHAEALAVAERALAVTARRLALPEDWRALNSAATAAVPDGAMSLLRFHLMALKGAGYLLLRLDRPDEGLARLDAVRALDPDDRLGAAALADTARAALGRPQPTETPMLDDDLKELEGAEDFLDYFGIAFDPAVVHVNRLHILQRFHDYVAAADLPADDDGRRRLHAELLARAYGDFVDSDARREKVFRVFRDAGKPAAPDGFVPLDRLET